MVKSPKRSEQRIEVREINMDETHMNLLGASPLIMHRFSQKAWRELLFPGRKENLASLEQNLKHDPVSEFRGAIYMNRDPKTKSAIHLPNGAIHGAIASAALDIPGAKKAQIERLTSVVDVNVELFGIPNLFCAMVRNSDMNRTPDVRTRPIFPEWACSVTVRYMRDVLSERTIVNLLGAAGYIVGIGDWRPQKGGSYGTFRIVGDDDVNFQRVVKQQARSAQLKAIEHPIFFDPESEELITWFEGEVARREMDAKLGSKKKKAKPPRGTKLHIEKSNSDGQYVGVEG